MIFPMLGTIKQVYKSDTSKHKAALLVVSLDCPFWIDPSVFSNFYFTILHFCVNIHLYPNLIESELIYIMQFSKYYLY